MIFIKFISDLKEGVTKALNIVTHLFIVWTFWIPFSFICFYLHQTTFGKCCWIFTCALWVGIGIYELIKLTNKLLILQILHTLEQIIRRHNETNLKK